MELPGNVLAYIARKKQDGGALGVAATNSAVGTQKYNRRRGYVGSENRISGEEADRQLMEMMHGW
jgi:hypothetical protein